MLDEDGPTRRRFLARLQGQIAKRGTIDVLRKGVAHFAVDEAEAHFCTHLQGKASWFLPFNLGWNDGAGNPPNPDGIKTDYLWRRVLARESLTNLLENYAQLVEEKDEKAGKKKRKQIWPRYHQLDVVRELLADADRVRKLITETIPQRVTEDAAYMNAQRNSDRENARIEHDSALLRVMYSIIKDDNQLYKQFVDNDSFKRWMTDTVFELTSEQMIIR